MADNKTDNKTTFKKLTPEERATLVSNLEDNLELLQLQRYIAEARASIKKADLESLLYAIKLDELKTPPKKDAPQN